MIQVDNIVKTFGNTRALDGLSCIIPKGCVFGLVGSNGAGKSTLLRLITGVYRADEGSVLVDELPVFDNPEAKKKIAAVSDELFFLPQTNLKKMGELYQGVYESFDKDRFKRLCADFELEERRSIQTFSKGMKRQAAIILALSVYSDYLLLDETFDGLDPIMRNRLKKIIAADVKDRGCTVLITSHSLRELEDTCDQLAMIHQGRMIIQSDVQNLKTSLVKIQIALNGPFGWGNFEGLELVNFIKRGSVANMIVRGEKEEVLRKLNQMTPVLLEALPLTLDEIFLYEMEALGYRSEPMKGDAAK